MNYCKNCNFKLSLKMICDNKCANCGAVIVHDNATAKEVVKLIQSLKKESLHLVQPL